MKPDTIKRLDDLYSSMPVLMAGQVPSTDVDRAEQLVGMSFDRDYREFVVRYGGAVVGSLPVLGLRRAEVMGDDSYSVVDVTARFRSDGWAPTEDWVVISIDLAGNPIGLTAEGEVWISDHDVGATRIVARCFEEFVLNLLDE